MEVRLEEDQNFTVAATVRFGHATIALPRAANR
jgi:hypothetical protein